MEWVETTAKTVEEAREAALDQLGVGADEAEFDVVEEPRPGLFGRVRGQARVRARVKPAQVRPKQDRRRRGREKSKSRPKPQREERPPTQSDADEADAEDVPSGNGNEAPITAAEQPKQKRSRAGGGNRSTKSQEQKMSNDERPESTVSPQEVGDAALAFMEGLTGAFGAAATSTLTVEGTELMVRTDGDELGLLVGSGGRTLNAIQDLARVSSQRRLGDHDTRLRIDVAGYRERRQAALARFAQDVAESVRTSGSARSLEPMSSADRKVIHDALNEEDGVASRSEGEDPNRRVVVEPA